MNSGPAKFSEVDQELRRRLYPGSVGQFLLFAVMMVATPLGRDHWFTALLCGSAITLGNLARLKLGFYFPRFAARPATWRSLYLFTTVVTGLAWGILNVMVLRHYDLTSLTTLYSFVNLCGIAAAGTTALSVRPRHARAFLVFLLLPPTIQLAVMGEGGWPLAALVLAYFGFLAAHASVQGRGFAALQEATSHYRAIADNSGEGILIHQAGKIVDINPAGARMFGFRTDEIVGKRLDLLLDPANLARGYAESAPHSGKIVQLEARRLGGQPFPVEICGIDCLWRGQAARAVRLRDLTESQRNARILERAKENAEASVAEQTAELLRVTEIVRESESRLEAMVEQSPLPTLVLSQDGRVIRASRAARTLWGLDNGAAGFLAGYNIARDPNWEEQGLVPLIEEGWRGKSSFLPSVFYEPARVGLRSESVWLEAFVAPITRMDGSVSEVTVTLRDITARRRAESERAAFEIRERAANEASRLKSEFLANMSHEIRTPMNGVLGMVDILLSTKLADEQREYAETVKRSGEGLLYLINDILDFSKIEAGKLELERVDFLLGDRLRDVERGFSTLASAKDITFTTDFAADLPRVLRGDPVRFVQILNNLLGNAVKFTDRGTVSLRVRNGAVGPIGRASLRIEVQDTGPGMSSEVRERLFQPFTQADASTTRKFGGTGLGLSITKSLVERMGGAIGVRSEPGQGALFWAEVSFEIGNPAAAAPSTAAEIPAALPPAAILLAEDNPINQKIALRMLEKLGLRVDVASDGRQALRCLAEKPYDLVFMDVQMPELDGLAATREFRALGEGPNRGVPIIALTANALKGDDQVCLEAGMNDYLSKPISAERLRVTLGKWLSGLRAGRTG